MIMLAQAHLELGHYLQAGVLLEEVHGLQRILHPESKGDPWAYRVHGFVEQMLGSYGRAVEYYRRSLLLRQETQQISGMAWALEGLVEVAVLMDQPLQAAHLGGAAERLRQEVGSVLSRDDVPRYTAALHTACQALGPAAYHVAWTSSAALPLAEAVAYALAD